jgi:LytS/YehU family sensor histidine kinase
VALSVCRDERDVLVEIVNDVDEKAFTSAGNGMGLALVRDRLQAVYGARAILTTGRVGGQFSATIRFPADDLDG